MKRFYKTVSVGKDKQDYVILLDHGFPSEKVDYYLSGFLFSFFKKCLNGKQAA